MGNPPRAGGFCNQVGDRAIQFLKRRRVIRLGYPKHKVGRVRPLRAEGPNIRGGAHGVTRPTSLAEVTPGLNLIRFRKASDRTLVITTRMAARPDSFAWVFFIAIGLSGRV